VAQLSIEEFSGLMDELVARHGLSKLQGQLSRANVVVSKKMIATPAMITRTLFRLTAGLAREGLASQVVLALWEEALGGALDEETGRELEALAEKINACLAHDLEIAGGKDDEIRGALTEYRGRLAGRIGERAARLTMMTRAVPAVARILREDEKVIAVD